MLYGWFEGSGFFTFRCGRPCKPSFSPGDVLRNALIERPAGGADRPGVPAAIVVLEPIKI